MTRESKKNIYCIITLNKQVLSGYVWREMTEFFKLKKKGILDNLSYSKC